MATTPNTFCWAELLTHDPTRTKQFYHSLFNWTSVDTLVNNERYQTIFRRSEHDVAGLSQQREIKNDNGPNWLSYVSVDNVDETVVQAQSLGATVIGEPRRMTAKGRMAVLEDPTGAVFALVERNSHFRATIMNEPGSVAWIELTGGADAATDFYTSFFGWGTKTMPMPEGEYTVFERGDEAVAGMMQALPEPEMNLCWLVNFAVADCDASTNTAKNLGAEVILPPTDLEGFGRVAALQDSEGAYFAIVANEDSRASQETGE